MWFRTDGTPQISSDRPAQGAEGIAVMHRPGVKLRWNSGGKRGVWVCGVERDNRQHPTQKPITLMESLIADFTDPGDLILDPFSGSGTTGVAAIRLGRRFIGWERDPKHAGTARKRLSAAREQLGLFTGAKVKAPKPLMLALGDK
jgi:DNA modification methylase